MQAIILAAGRGSRMGQATEQKPKCHTRICGKPLIRWQIDGLRAAGISDVLVIRGYRAQMLSGDFETIDNPHWETTNMAASLVCADHWLSRAPAIVSYADIVYHPDHIRTLMSCAGNVAITADRNWLDLWKLRFNDPLADAEMFAEQDGRLKVIGGKATNVRHIAGQYMGLLRFTPAGWDIMSTIYGRLTEQDRAGLDMTSWLALALGQGRAIQCRYVQGRWCEIDSMSDLGRYKSALDRASRNGTVWSHDWRWR